MNILFYLYGECCPTTGGIQRVTDVIVNGLSTNLSYKFFCIYKVSAPENVKRTSFSKTFCMPEFSESTFSNIICDNNIDIIVNQECHWDSKRIKAVINRFRPTCKIIYELHIEPLTDALEFVKFKYILSQVCRNPNLGTIAKFICYPLYKIQNLNKIRKLYREAYLYSDIVILLSNSFKIPFLNAAKIKESPGKSKITSIPNMTSFHHFASTDDIQNKQKRVLYVGRLNDSQKRISLLLKIWKQIEADSRFDDWSLDIVGDGPEMAKFQQIASPLSRVVFYGWDNPVNYYQRAAIFVMTSEYEGWGMTLTESSQFGCVPIAFDTYASLSDIIENENNGFVVKEGNVIEYINKLKLLMSDTSVRFALATNAVKKAHRYSQKNVLAMWNNLFNNLID